jgi:hypothetical protein
MKSVWVFNGVQSPFPSAVFSSKGIAEAAWINKHHLTGTLTQYPLDTGMYDHAILEDRFMPSKPEHESATFIGRFTGGGIDHFHYEDGNEG